MPSTTHPLLFYLEANVHFDTIIRCNWSYPCGLALDRPYGLQRNSGGEFVYLAADGGLSSRFLKTAVEGTMNILRQANEAGIKYVSIASSIAAVISPDEVYTKLTFSHQG